jgi:hypothetical protein
VKIPRQALVIVLGAIFVAIGIWLGIYFGQSDSDPSSSPSIATVTTPAGPGPAANPSTAMPDQSPVAMLSRMFARLRAGGLVPGELDAFRRAVLAAPPEQAIAAIVQFLASGQDAVTGETFALGEGGLAGAPTYRVLLLDLLGRICRKTGTIEAASVARTILQTKTSADEWAVALRNIGWITPQERTFLTEKTRELIRYAPWREQPSAGYREAFDLIVHAGDVTLIPDLSEMLKAEDESLQSSAAVALDRLAESSPLLAMTFLNENRDELAEKPFLRADYFSKADLSQPAQRLAVETYLGRPDVEVREKAKMLAVLASPGSFASETLITQPPPDEFPPQRIAGLRKSVDDWLTTNRFPALIPPLQQLQARISQ